jgi:hypothetical protein
MKLVLGAAVAALLFASPAFAQSEGAPATSTCGAVAPAPALPDGATATYEQMETGNTSYDAWYESNRVALECRRAEVVAAEARYQTLRTAFNTNTEEVTAARTSWEAEVAEFNARSPARPNRGRSQRSITD